MKRLKSKNIYNKPKQEKEKPAFMEGGKPIRENVSLEEIMIEQGYKPCTYDEFRAVADQIEWGNVLLEEFPQTESHSTITFLVLV